MRGYAQFNMPAFDAGTQLLRAAGYQVFSPAEHNRDQGFDFIGADGFEDLAELGFDLRATLATDLDYVCRHTDIVALLPGWQDSAGAKAEYATAQALGIPALDLAGVLEIGAMTDDDPQLPALRRAGYKIVEHQDGARRPVPARRYASGRDNDDRKQAGL